METLSSLWPRGIGWILNSIKLSSKFQFSRTLEIDYQVIHMLVGKLENDKDINVDDLRLIEKG